MKQHVTNHQLLRCFLSRFSKQGHTEIELQGARNFCITVCRFSVFNQYISVFCCRQDTNFQVGMGFRQRVRPLQCDKCELIHVYTACFVEQFADLVYWPVCLRLLCSVAGRQALKLSLSLPLLQAFISLQPQVQLSLNLTNSIREQKDCVSQKKKDICGINFSLDMTDHCAKEKVNRGSLPFCRCSLR